MAALFAILAVGAILVLVDGDDDPDASEPPATTAGATTATTPEATPPPTPEGPTDVTTGASEGANSSLAPPGEIPEATEEPDGLGDDPTFDDAARDCFDGDMQACDDLYVEADAGSDYERYGDTCAGRQDEGTRRLCTVAFPGYAATGLSVRSACPADRPDGPIAALRSRGRSGRRPSARAALRPGGRLEPRMGILDRILRAGEGKKLKALQAMVPDVNALEPELERLTDEQLQAKTPEFRQRLANGADLDDIAIEAFAVTREAAKRVIGQRHFDVQLMGGAALHFGWVAEMKTGEGKTLVSTLPAYLNGVGGKGVHLVTVNDYLARFHAEWMGRIHGFLGLHVGLILPGVNASPAEKRQQYAADITYGTNNEFGFDYLRDNMAGKLADKTQRGHNFAIVDEVDSILIDEARTPLIISGRVADAAKLYYRFASIIRTLQRDVDYEVEEDKRVVVPLEAGIDKVEAALGVENIYDEVQQNLVHQLQVALKAKELYKRDKDYIIQGGEVKIVDEFTGRILEGRRWSEGIHQAVEAKEGVKIKEENQTLATITLQNYFRMYDKLAGMTGTAATEAAELMATYELGVVPIPTNVPVQRIDQADLIYKGEVGKFDAVTDDIAARYEAGQPVLVGTVSVEKSEYLSRQLRQRGIDHEVLNAKQHTREALIVAQAGRKHAVTVATNMAGRGVDIKLGGDPEGLAQHEVVKEGHAPEVIVDVSALPLPLDQLPEDFREARGKAMARYDGAARRVRRAVQGRGRRRPRARRAVRHRLRAPRVAAHRQPAAWPLRPSGRPRREPLLPQPRRRADAPVRHRRPVVRDEQGAARRRGDRGEDGHQGHRARPDHRRDAQRRDPQERPQVRRGDERAAQGDLRAP